MIMHLSTKGQVTIPQSIREQAGLLAGSAVDIAWQKGAVILRPTTTPGRSPGRRLVQRVQSSGVRPVMSTEELLALTRGEDD